MAFGPSMTKIVTSYVPSLITLLTLTRPCGHPFSLRTSTGKHVYNIAAVVVISARRNTAYAGARPPSRIFFPSSTRNLPHMTRMGLYSNRGQRTCASGVAVTLAASTKVIAGVMPLEITTPAPTKSNGNSHYQGNSNGPPSRTHFAAAAPQPLAPSSAPGPPPALTAAPLMRYGPTATGNTNPNARRPVTFQVPPTTTP